MSEATNQYEAADEQISKIIEAVNDPTQVDVRFKPEDSFYSFCIYYDVRTFDLSAEELIKNHDFMIHPKSFHKKSVTIYNNYE